MSKRTILASCLAIALTLLVALAFAYEIQGRGELYWDDPTVAKGYVECQVESLNDAKLIESVRVERLSDHIIVFSGTLDTGVRGSEVISSGLFVKNPWHISIETDLFEREPHRLIYCHHWQIEEGLCEGWSESGEGMVCLQPIDDGNLIPVDEDCCWVAGTLTGTMSLKQYLPFIIKDWGYEHFPIRP